MTDKQLEEIITRKCGAYRNYSSMTHMQAKYCMKQAIEADRAERSITPEIAKKIIATRDAITHEDYDEAWHQLYSIASPEFDKTEPWKELEEIALTPTEDK